MDCEICGSEEAEYLVLVEGARLSLCRNCSDSGKVVRPLFVPGKPAAERGRDKA